MEAQLRKQPWGCLTFPGKDPLPRSVTLGGGSWVSPVNCHMSCGWPYSCLSAPFLFLLKMHSCLIHGSHKPKCSAPSNCLYWFMTGFFRKIFSNSLSAITELVGLLAVMEQGVKMALFYLLAAKSLCSAYCLSASSIAAPSLHNISGEKQRRSPMFKSATSKKHLQRRS